MSPEEVAKIDGVDIVVGTKNKLKVFELISNGKKANIVTPVDKEDYEDMEITLFESKTRAIIKAQDGCNNFCAYCIIPYARGRIRSRDLNSIYNECKRLSENGFLEIVLAGIHICSYGKDLEKTFSLSELLALLDARHSCERIRLGSLAPELIGADFAERISKLKILVPHFHVSVQSGSNSVLAAMKRRYNRQRALENVERLRTLIPEATFTADIMVGFPGESDEDFLESVDFVRRARLLDAPVFAFSAREGTPAYDMDNQVSQAVKRERSRIMIEEKNRVRDSVLSDMVLAQRILPSVFESACGEYYAGHSDTFSEVRVKSARDVRGELLMVRPLYHEDGIIYGEIV